MGILDSFEKGLERAINGAFAKTFKSGLQPLEITAALRRELDTKAQVVDRDRILVPNIFTVSLSPNDLERMQSLGSTLTDELTQLVQKHAQAQRYQFSGGIEVTLHADPAVAEGTLRVDSRTERTEVRWNPVLEVNGRRHVLRVGSTVIGRGSDADITVADSGISRKHVEVLWDGHRAQAKDLGSTNGSELNGKKFKTEVMAPESVITIGRTRIVFRVLAESTGRQAAAHDGFWG